MIYIFLGTLSSFLFSIFYFHRRFVGLRYLLFLFCFFKDCSLFCSFTFHITVSYNDMQTQRLLLHDIILCIPYSYYMRMIWNINILCNWNKIFLKHTLEACEVDVGEFSTFWFVSKCIKLLIAYLVLFLFPCFNFLKVFYYFFKTKNIFFN